MTISEIWTSKDVWWSYKGGQEERGEHGRNFTTNHAIHVESNSFIYWTEVAKTFRNKLSHGIGHGEDDKWSEPVELPFIVTKC